MVTKAPILIKYLFSFNIQKVNYITKIYPSNNFTNIKTFQFIKLVKKIGNNF